MSLLTLSPRVVFVFVAEGDRVCVGSKPAHLHRHFQEFSCSGEHGSLRDLKLFDNGTSARAFVKILLATWNFRPPNEREWQSRRRLLPVDMKKFSLKMVPGPGSFV